MSDHDISKPRQVDFNNRPKRALAQASKLVYDSTTRREYDENDNRKPSPPPHSLLNAISERTASVQSDLESMRQLLPDIELSTQILVSSILSPKDMGVPELSFMVANGFKYPEIGGKLIRIISEYFTNDYKINDELSTVIRDALFDKGSHIRMIVPESSLDAIINDNGRLTLESISPLVDVKDSTVKNIGLLGPGLVKEKSNQGDTTFSLESALKVDYRPVPQDNKVGSSYLTVVDNPDAIKMPELFKKISKDRYSSVMASRFSSLESRKVKSKKKEREKEKIEGNPYGKTDREIEQSLKGTRQHKAEPFMELQPKDMLDRETLGHPLVVQLATEAVIPAHMPGDPDNHIGYYVLIDQFGNAISTATAADYYRDLQASFQRNATENSVTSVLKEMRGAYGDIAGGDGINDVGEATKAFADIVERDLLKRLRSGVGHDSVDLSRPSAVYQIMLARTMQKKRTQILYVPKELLSYIAFYYTKQGIGKSLLEENRIIGSMRAILMFANIMGQIRNSTSLTELDIQLDEKDPDPLTTVEMIKSAFMRSRATNFPLGEGNASVIVDYLQQAGVNVVYSGHPGLPEMRVQTNDTSTNKAQIDRDLEEHLRHQHIMGWGLSPESVDMSSDVNYATTVVSSNLMLSKRVSRYQLQFESMQADFIQKFTRNSETLITRLERVIEKEGDTELKERSIEVIEEFIDSIEVSLPKPDTVTLDAHLEALRTYRDILEQAVDAWISDEFTFRDTDGELGEKFRELKTAVVSHFLRRWFRENNVLPEIDELTSKDDEGNPLLNFGEVHSEHMESIMASLEIYIEEAKTRDALRTRRSEKAEKVREEMISSLDQEPEEEEVEDDSTDDSTDDTSVDDGDDDSSAITDDSGDDGDDSSDDSIDSEGSADDDGGDSGDDDIDDLFGDDGFMDSPDESGSDDDSVSEGESDGDTAETVGEDTSDAVDETEETDTTDVPEEDAAETDVTDTGEGNEEEEDTETEEVEETASDEGDTDLDEVESTDTGAVEDESDEETIDEDDIEVPESEEIDDDSDEDLDVEDDIESEEDDLDTDVSEDDEIDEDEEPLLDESLDVLDEDIDDLPEDVLETDEDDLGDDLDEDIDDIGSGAEEADSATEDEGLDESLDDIDVTESTGLTEDDLSELDDEDDEVTS